MKAFARKPAEPAASPQADGGGSSDLLIRFFESAWFDAYIALTYLYKSHSPGVQDYLCNRLYTLPERDVEHYLGQLTQLCIQRPGSSLERVLTDLCAQSLRIAVKTYWLLLAISQDLPKDAHVAALRDACEQAALQGHWQLPFKQSRLPPPLSMSPAKRRGGASSQASPLLISPTGSFTHLQRPGWVLSPEPRRGGLSDSQQMLSPGDGGDSRPMSPDGLGGGLYSSVFMDTGVEGLIYSVPQMDEELREHRQHVSSPRTSHGALLEGPGRPLLPVRVDAQRVSSLQQELGEGEGVSALLMRSATAGDGGGPGVVQQWEEAAEAAASAAAAAGGRSMAANGGSSAYPAGAAALLSPPNSPRRRQTTFGATLDFVETLCQASSSLTAFQPEDRQWALRRALQQINVEIEKASRNGVAIWFPMGTSNLRVVRLAPRESRLLNSREKAPFTLCVEVLDEDAAAAAVEARVAAAAAAAATAVEAKAASPASPVSQCADSAKSVLMAMEQPPAVADGAAAAAAAEAAANGIPFIANHHRTQSMDTISTSSSSMEAAVVAAVHGSSAVTGDAVAAAKPSPPAASSSPRDSSPRDSVRSGDALASEPSFAGMLAGPGSPAQGGGGGGGGAGSPARPRRLTDDLDAVSDVPSLSECSSGMLGSPNGVSGEGDALLAEPNSSSSVHFGAHPPPPQAQQQEQQRQQQDAQPPSAAQSQLPALSLQQKPCGKLPGAGTWIGGSKSPVAAAKAAAVEALARTSASSSNAHLMETFSSGLETALAGLRGEVPLVAVRLEVLNDTPLHSARGAGSSESPRQQHPDGASLAAASAERRRASLDAASRAPPHHCDRSSWACKLGLFKLCNTKLATRDDEEDPRLGSAVRVHFTVQGGVDLTIRKTPAKHQRMPSHEAILKVAKQHKLPAPDLPHPLAPPAQQNVAAQQQQQQQRSRGSSPLPPRPQQGLPADHQQLQVPGGAVACLPVWRPAGPSGGPGSGGKQAPALDSEEAQRKQVAEAAYGERWASRKGRVQTASPHGRRPGWDLRCVIVKTGDDCRQELLAMQLIRAAHEIFAEAQLPLWLRPYEVLPTSNRTALIEMVPNAPSIHALKSKHAPGTSLRDHLAAKFGVGSAAFQRAQRCFVESLAGYSLVCYLLQIKDRHNGNILLDDEGHLIHIDFGFMLSNSPGGVNFESAPFKLTRELLEVMESDSEGRASELFDYFKVLMIQGFLALRKHADRILLLVEMMQGSGCPCFKSCVMAVQGLKKRFHLTLPEPQLVEVVLGLISDSLDAWRTRQYDYYQRVLNGIL